jgi:hypothetical protein
MTTSSNALLAMGLDSFAKLTISVRDRPTSSLVSIHAQAYTSSYRTSFSAAAGVATGVRTQQLCCRNLLITHGR